MRGLTLDATLEPAHVSGDPRLIERLVSNLSENALLTTSRRRMSTVAVVARAAPPTLRVVNTGPVVPPTRWSACCSRSSALRPARRPPRRAGARAVDRGRDRRRPRCPSRGDSEPGRGSGRPGRLSAGERRSAVPGGRRRGAGSRAQAAGPGQGLTSKLAGPITAITRTNCGHMIPAAQRGRCSSSTLAVCVPGHQRPPSRAGSSATDTDRPLTAVMMGTERTATQPPPRDPVNPRV